MGSGELTATMVQAHKDLLSSLDPYPRAVFLDTPAGFELNVDQISQRVVEYFRSRVLRPLSVASFKFRESASTYEGGKAFRTLEEADYILIGPGSPTYALRHWKDTPVPEIMLERIRAGGCLVAASAAALTVGRFTVPVYEIYKVGLDPFWAEGMDILGQLGFPLVVVPHWNNAEGGSFDTRFCFMGEPRFRALEAQLPEDLGVLGLDEHTACILDFENDEAAVRGIGSVTLRMHGSEISFRKGDRFPLGILREGRRARGESGPDRLEQRPHAGDAEIEERKSFWDRIHEIEHVFQSGLGKRDPGEATNALLELDRSVWKAQQDLEAPVVVSEAREVFRDLIVQLGMTLEASPLDRRECLSPLVESLLALRAALREKEKWEEADAVRGALRDGGILIEDTPAGPRWRLEEEHPRGAGGPKS
jgi:cyanophycinase-like exopeptidase